MRRTRAPVPCCRYAGEREQECSCIRSDAAHNPRAMLNYIWAGLIIFSLVFAVWNDVLDLHRDTYRNGQSLPVVIERAANAGGAEAPAAGVSASKDVTVRVEPQAY